MLYVTGPELFNEAFSQNKQNKDQIDKNQLYRTKTIKLSMCVNYNSYGNNGMEGNGKHRVRRWKWVFVWTKMLGITKISPTTSF